MAGFGMPALKPSIVHSAPCALSASFARAHPGRGVAGGVCDDDGVMEPGPVLRALRAAVFTAVCVMLSAAGHEWMSGRAVAWWGLLAASAGVFCGAYATGGRRRGFPVIAGLMLVGQTGLHELFSVAQGATATDGWIRFTERATVVIGGLVHPHPATGTAWAQMPMVMPPGTSMPGMPPMGSGGAASGMAMSAAGHDMTAMAAAHVFAALVCSWWLARGEASVFGLLLALVMAAFAPLRASMAGCGAGAQTPRTRTIEVGERRTCYALVLAHSLVRRGPPACCASL